MAMDILGEAWNISQKGEEIITDNNTVKDRGLILKNALNADLKEIGSPVLNKIQNKNNISQVVLQIQKIRNISAPKANENSQAAPRMLKLVLTDGDSYIQAVETTPVASINLERTPPGTKILIQSAKIVSGYILLDSNNCSLLGGHVPALFEKWELAKSVQHYTRTSSSSDGPPAWVNFGCKIQSDIQDKSFKSLENKNQESRENSKFDLQRQDAIAEATSGAVKKVFGGGLKLPVQAPSTPRPKKINLPNKDRKNKNKPNTNKDVEDKPQKPSEKVSLFDFLEDKLPANETEPSKPIVNSNNNSNYTPRNFYNPENNRNRNTHFKPNEQYNSYKTNEHYNSYKTNEQYNSHKTNEQYNSYKTNEQYSSYKTKEQYHSYKTKNDNHFSAKPTVPVKNEVNLDEVNGLNNSFAKLSVNSQFASRSLKQHLNLGPQKKQNAENVGNTAWKVGDDCVAKYWEDGKFYNAIVTAITDKTCVVKFKGYGNIEEVLKSDCLPVSNNEMKKAQHTGPLEFRTRTYRRQ